MSKEAANTSERSQQQGLTRAASRASFDVRRLANGLTDEVVADLIPRLPKLDMAEYPGLGGYSWEQCHEGFKGAGGLFLVSEIADQMGLSPGMRVLDLGAGNCAGSVFLAKQYGVRVYAVDRCMDVTECLKRTGAAGVAHLVTPLASDVTDLPFPQSFFDCVIAINSYLYFGTDDAYLPYLCRFLKPGGFIGIGSPCYSRELPSDAPRELLYDRPDFLESRVCHSPGWWRRHFTKTGLVQVLSCAEHPKGREFWLDDLRHSLETLRLAEMSPEFRTMILDDLVMMLSDTERLVTYLTLLATRPRGASWSH